MRVISDVPVTTSTRPPGAPPPPSMPAWFVIGGACPARDARAIHDRVALDFFRMTATASPLRASLLAARANLVPGIVLQCVAGAVVAGYFLHPPARAALENLAAFRTRIGLPFALVSTAIFGALLPFAVLRLSKATRHRYDFAQMAALTLFWAYKGMEISLFYALQARVFGEGQSAAVIIAKTAVDQFVYGPLLAAPLTWLVYAWVELRFDTRALVAELRLPGLYGRSIFPLLVASWSVWVPAVAIIYLLPTALQLPLQNIVCCFFTLLIIFMTRRPDPAPATASQYPVAHKVSHHFGTPRNF